MKALYLSVAFFLLFVTESHSQFVEHIVTSGFNTGDIAAYDYDGDGDDDLLIAGYSSLMISIYNGTTYASPVVLADGVNWPNIEIVDLDGDNVDDIFLNFQDAGGYISSEENSIPTSYHLLAGVASNAYDYSLNLADINGDGLPDLIYATNEDMSTPYSVDVYYNLGEFLFAGPTTSYEFSIPQDGYVAQIYYSDMDFDNDYDMIVRAQEDEINWWENDGFGSFDVEHTLIQDVNLWPYAYDGIKNILTQDLNNDGYKDLIINAAYHTPAAASGNYPNTALCFLGDGFGFTFNNYFETNIYAPFNTHSELMDVNGDGTIDLPAVVASNYVTINSQSYHDLSIGYYNSVLENDGTLTEINSIELTNDLLNDFVYANGEVLIGMGTQGCRIQHILLDGTAGEYAELVSAPVQCIGEILDYDLDNDLDILVQGIGDNSLAFGLIANDGNGNFSSTIEQIFDPTLYSGNSYKFADLNSDGMMDCIHTQQSGILEMNVAVFFQNSDQIFTEGYVSSSFTHDSSFGEQRLTCDDINDDGQKDFGMVNISPFGDYPPQVFYWLSDGAGNFEETIIDLPEEANALFDCILSVSDMNGDGLKDLVSNDDYNMPIVLLNDGTGNFIVPTALNSNWYNNVTMLDYDMDGILDVLGHDSSSSFNWQFCGGNEDGTFNDPIPMDDLTYSDYSEWPALVADFDQNGMDDFILFGYLFLRYDDGTFMPEIDLGNAGLHYGCYFINTQTYDFNNDGFPDLINNQPDQRIKWYQNIFNSPYAMNTTAFIDENGNNIKDNNESVISNLPVHLNNSYSLYTNDLGEIHVPVLEGIYDLEVDFDPTLWSLDNALITVEINDAQPIAEIAFAFQPTTPVVDVAIHTISDFPLCSFASTQWITAVNTGNISHDGVLQVTFDGNVTVSSFSPQPDSYTNNSATWNYFNLSPFAVFEVSITSIMPDFSFMGIPITMTSDVTATNTIEGLISQANDLFTENLSCAYDPNDKRELNSLGEEGWIEQNSKLQYLVRFQNTGNATAETVVIKDQLSSHLDWLSLQPIASSHNLETAVDAFGLASFTFSNIMLPDSSSDEPGSHGYVLFEINQLQDVLHLTQINNTAEIYFDLNPEVITNTFTNTVFNCSEFNAELSFENGSINSSLSGPQMNWSFNNTPIADANSNSLNATAAGMYSINIRFGEDCVVTESIEIISVEENFHDLFTVYPNPASDIVQIQFEHRANRLITVFDVTGKEVGNFNCQTEKFEFAVSNLPQGVYHVKVFCSENNSMSGVDIIVE